ncbi:hypothetical protein AUJ14_05510 [Candidatus Micrarchaeota archaeon CG1_02_55_22]|nr:MAG: hypothetical protein AUJ14_05510 [Candidatus Micrarchaeota archaeon CG1_02_55_22]
MAIQTFQDFEEFEAAAKAKGISVDLKALLALQLTFYEQYEDHVIISMKGYDEGPDNCNNVLIMFKDNTLVYTKYQFNDNDYKLFKHTMQKEYGESTVATLLTFKYTLATYQRQFDSINKFIDDFNDANPDVDALESKAKHLRRLINRVEDLLDVMIWLEDRKIRQVNTSYVSYDYDVLTAKVRYLIDRSQNHRQEIQNIRNDLEVRSTRDVNKRLESLNVAVKRLTAITIILMIPNVVAGHFGMNFQQMIIPWNTPYGEYAAIGASAILMLATYYYMKKKDWF